VILRSALIALGTLAAVPAAAQSGAMWTDDRGRMMSLGLAGDAGIAPDAVVIEPAAMAGLFKQVCVAGAARADGVASAAATLPLTKIPFQAAGKNPPVFALWRGDGVVISQADTFLGNKSAQCNATFYVAGLPAKDAVVAAVTAALGAAPANAAAAVGKNGKPARWWNPEWSVTATDGTPLVAVVFVIQGSRDMPGDRVQFSLRVASKKGT